MMDCCECRFQDGTLYDALENIIWYDEHYVWLKELRDELMKLPDGETYINPFRAEDWHTEKHTIWMLLVGMFGDWGTSIGSGWITDCWGCVRFIDAICKESWEADNAM